MRRGDLGIREWVRDRELLKSLRSGQREDEKWENLWKGGIRKKCKKKFQEKFIHEKRRGN